MSFVEYAIPGGGGKFCHGGKGGILADGAPGNGG